MSILRVVIGYRIVSGETVAELEENVNKLVNIASANWEPHGSPTKVGPTGEGFYMQAMTLASYSGGEG